MTKRKKPVLWAVLESDDWVHIYAGKKPAVVVHTGDDEWRGVEVTGNEITDDCYLYFRRYVGPLKKNVPVRLIIRYGGTR